jgi:hypothetical protein
MLFAAVHESACDPGCVKTFFRPQKLQQPGTIRIDTTV